MMLMCVSMKPMYCRMTCSDMKNSRLAVRACGEEEEEEGCACVCMCVCGGGGGRGKKNINKHLIAGEGDCQALHEHRFRFEVLE